MRWIRVQRGKPCPICGHNSWCSVSADGQVVVCMRAESPKPCKSGGWFHNLSEPVKYRPPARKAKPVPTQNFTTLATTYVENLRSPEKLASELGVSVRSLERLQMGWNGKGYTFPMRDGRERIIGIRVRGRKGKWAVPGSHNGLFWPQGVYSGSDWPVIICEGVSDCAALLDMEYDCIGRPGCLGAVGHVIEFLKGCRRDVVIIADHDPPKEQPDGSKWLPGEEGARRLSSAIKPFVRGVKIIKPALYKDVRAWRNAGANHDVILSLTRNTRYVV